MLLRRAMQLAALLPCLRLARLVHGFFAALPLRRFCQEQQLHDMLRRCRCARPRTGGNGRVGALWVFSCAAGAAAALPRPSCFPSVEAAGGGMGGSCAARSASPSPPDSLYLLRAVAQHHAAAWRLLCRALAGRLLGTQDARWSSPAACLHCLPFLSLRQAACMVGRKLSPAHHRLPFCACLLDYSTTTLSPLCLLPLSFASIMQCSSTSLTGSVCLHSLCYVPTCYVSAGTSGCWWRRTCLADSLSWLAQERKSGAAGRAGRLLLPAPRRLSRTRIRL